MINKRLLRRVFCLDLAFSFIASMLILSYTIAAPKPTPIPAEKPQYGGVLKIITTGGIINLGYPAQPNNPFDITYGAPAIETLLRYDEKGTPIPGLATGWKISPDSKSITFTLRKGVKFHDGTDFNAEAVKFLLDMYRTSPKGELKGVSSVDIIEDYTIRLNLSGFEGHILSSLGVTPGLMVSPTALKSNPKEWCFTNPVGTGPFKIVSHQRDVSLKYQRFDGYWQKGKPYIDGVEFKIIADPTTALMAFKAGEAQEIMRLEVKDAAELQGLGKYIIDKNPVAVFGLAGDGGNPRSPFADIRVRRAVEYAIDKEKMIKELYYGLYEAVHQTAVSESINYNPAVVGYSYNPQKAKDLLSQAGYPNGFKTRLIFRTNDNKDLFTAIQGYLSEVGIDAKMEIVTPALYSQITNSGWDNGLVYWNLPCGRGMDPGQAAVRNLSNKSILFKSAIHPEAFEAKLSQAVSEPNFEKRKAFFQELTMLIVDEYCMVCPIYLGYGIAARTPKVNNGRIFEIWPTSWTPEEVWLSK